MLSDELESRDGSLKLVFTTRDGFHYHDAVFYDEEQDKNKAVIASGVGCPVGCVFCMTRVMPFIRDLRKWEVRDQAVACVRCYSKLKKPEAQSRIVFAGMADCCINRKNTVPVMDEFSFLGHQIGVHTAGIPGHFEEALQDFRSLTSKDLFDLRISLQFLGKDRERYMRGTGGYPVEVVIRLAYDFCQEIGKQLWLNHTLFKGYNDSWLYLKAVAKLAKRWAGVGVKLSPANPCGRFVSSAPEVFRMWQTYLEDQGIPFRRITKSYGADIDATMGRTNPLFCTPGELREAVLGAEYAL